MHVETVEAPQGNTPYALAVLATMRRLVERGAVDPTVQRIARELNGATQYQTLVNDWHYLKQRVPYVPDPPNVEKITSAKYTVGRGQGEDCDGQSVAVATVLALQGIPSLFRVVAWRSENFTHVLTVALLSDGTEVPFDLTQDRLGITYNYHTNIDSGIIMPTIQSISDRSTRAHQVTDLVVQMLKSPDQATRKRAYRLLEKQYPREMTFWITQIANDAAMQGRAISDGYGDWLGTALEWAGNIVGSVVGVPVAGTLTKGLVDTGGGKSAGADTSKAPADADPNRPGRSVHDARTYIEELNQIYPPGPRVIPQTVNDGCNYASVLHVPTYPKLDQHLDTDHPGHNFCSWDGESFWISDIASIDANPVGNAYELTFTYEGGKTSKGPNLYARKLFSDGAERYDNVGKSSAGVPPITTGEAQTNQSTSARADNGLPPKDPGELPKQPITPGASSGGAASSTPGSEGGQSAGVIPQGAGLFSGDNTMLYVAGGALLLLLLMKK